MSTGPKSKWSNSKAQEWFKGYPWICGFNFLPSSSVNFLEMWTSDTFDPTSIEQELGLAASVGFNAVRVNLHFLVWKHDRNGLINRIEQFLTIAWSKNIYTVLVPFDDCGFGGLEPKYGQQLAPIEGIHNSRAVASPGRATVMDRTQWKDLKEFVIDVIGHFATDNRILFWDLYNEPGNRMIFEKDACREYDTALEANSLALMKLTFEWARYVGPTQPLTVGAWRTAPVGTNDFDFDNVIDQTALRLSDIVTFHAYLDRNRILDCIESLSKLDRPVFLTEWMARAVGSCIDTQLELLQNHNIGCFNWGMVRGRTQTYLPWPRPLLEQHGINPNEAVWFHDIFWPDGQPYDPAEIEILQRLMTTPQKIIGEA